MFGRSKGTVFFFFPGKVCTSLTHSFWVNFVFFFSTKKIQVVFFFSQEKFESHSLEKNNIICKKSSKNGKLENFRRFSSFGGVFFFPTIFCIFFSQEKFTFHSLTHSQGAGKKNTAVEKKIHHFHSLTRFLPKNGKS